MSNPASNDLAMLYTMAQQATSLPALQPAQRYGMFTRWRIHREAQGIQKAIGEKFISIASATDGPERQDSLTNFVFEAFGAYDDARGVQEQAGITFDLLRRFAHNCEPLAAIISKRVEQFASYAQLPEARRGYVKKPGFRIRMTDPSAEPTEQDKAEIAKWERFVMEGGFCEPPEDERPENYEPGLEHYIRCLVRDSYTLDWSVTRTWRSEQNPQQLPVVTFAAVDAGRHRLFRPKLPKGVDNGRLIMEDNPLEGALKSKKVRYVQTNSDSTAGMVVAGFTKEEMFHAIRNPRTELTANGYGYSESERAINTITGWVYGREYNMSRFRKDTLPRGILAILGQLDRTQFEMFKLEWKQMLQGLANRWAIPIVRGLPQTGSSVTWTPLDLSSRDMEYHQFMFSLALWMHAIFQIHPEETGYEALSPFKPPLSEASPEVKLKYSQDTGFSPGLRWLQTLINRKILWRNIPDKRYMLEFVGVGEVDEAQDVEVRNARLGGGLSTPRMEWAELDQPIPEPIADHPAWDLPMPFAMGMQYIDNLQQMQVAQEQAQQQQQAQQQMMQPQGAGQGQPMGGADMGQMPGMGQDLGQDLGEMPSQPSPMGKARVGIILSKRMMSKSSV